MFFIVSTCLGTNRNWSWGKTVFRIKIILLNILFQDTVDTDVFPKVCRAQLSVSLFLLMKLPYALNLKWESLNFTLILLPSATNLEVVYAICLVLLLLTIVHTPITIICRVRSISAKWHSMVGAWFHQHVTRDNLALCSFYDGNGHLRKILVLCSSVPPVVSHFMFFLAEGGALPPGWDTVSQRLWLGLISKEMWKAEQRHKAWSLCL